MGFAVMVKCWFLHDKNGRSRLDYTTLPKSGQNLDLTFEQVDD